MRYKEECEQSAFVKWFKLQYPHYALNIFSIPNGQNVGERAGKRLKRTGLLKGAPDLFIAVPTLTYSGLFIEMKAKGGRVSEDQMIVHEALKDSFYKVEVCWSAEEAINSVKMYLNRPKRQL